MTYDREQWARIRIIIVGSIFGLLFLCVMWRSFDLQILQHETLGKRAEKQHQSIIPLTPFRGTIMDRNGTPMALSLEMESCYAEPKNIRDIPGTAEVLAPFLGIDKKELQRKIVSAKSFTWLSRKLPPETVVKVKNLRLPGIGFAPEPKRFYPNFEVAAHVVGFTGADPVGLEGIELKYESIITGNTGYLVTEKDALGRKIELKNTVIKKSSPGRSLVLTLDKNIQYLVEKELAKAVTDCGAKGGMALVMEPQTGKVLGMANYPTFNPNSFSTFPASHLRNRVVADSFEPGSTFKVFLVAAALEEKLVRAGDHFNCEHGSYRVADRTIHDTHPYASLTVSDIIKYSSNIGAAKIGFKLGNERLSRYLKNFGFGDRTGIDLPGESPGNLREGQRWYGIELATISFGQGISASAMQLGTAISAIANGGMMMKPYLVERILDDNGEITSSFEPQPLRRTISEGTAKTITRMMETVTTQGGTGTSAAVTGFRVAGKTGTAQKVDPATRQYSPSKRTASFVGFVPADNPKLTIVIIIDEPKTSPYGGVVAAPAFSEIATSSLAYLKVHPQGEQQNRPKVIEVRTTPSAPSTAAAEGDALDIPAGGVMPNFRGMSMRRVLQVMEKQNLNIRLIGSGQALEQSPPPGHAIQRTDEVWIKFSPAA